MMTQHVKIFGILHIVFGVLVVLAGVIVLIVMGGIAGFVGASHQSAELRRRSRSSAESAIWCSSYD